MFIKVRQHLITKENKLENMILIGKILEKHVWSTIKNMHLVLSIKNQKNEHKNLILSSSV